MIELVDTHCHIQSIGADSDDFTVKKWHKAGVDDVDKVIESANKARVTRLICVGTDLEDSQLAIDLANKRENCWASVGIHPHEASSYFRDVATCRTAKQSAPSQLSAQHGVADSSAPLRYQKYRSVRASSSPSAASDHENSSDPEKTTERLAKSSRVVAVGEVGLDYFYEHSPKKDQIKLLELFLQLAQDTKLPVIFHVREAHADFWPLFDNFKNLRGVMHSFSAGPKVLNQALERNLYVGMNGIMTFTKDASQLAAAKAVPLEKLLLETDAPYLTPNPHRGKICKPENVYDVAKFLADLRAESIEELSAQTSMNARNLFNIA